MTRIIGGTAGGRRLRTPSGDATRPTSDRVREAIFSAVESRVGTLSGLRVLDLYAGSGALGLEAWSRGAAAVTFVERDRRTAALVTANARELGCGGAQVLTGAVRAVLSRPPDAPYDLVLSDPPYPLPDQDVETDLRLLADHGWLAEDATVMVERGTRGGEFGWPEGFEAAGSRRYGETTVRWGLWYGPETPSSTATPPESGA